jgi:hypothetical protein
MEVYVGMDVHRKRSQVALLDQDGSQMLNRNLPNDPAELVPILGTLAPGTPVAFEAAYGWGWLADLLAELGLEPHLVHPSRSHGDRLGQAQRRPGRRAHAGAPAARRPATGGLDRPTAGPRPARPAAPPRRAGTHRDRAEEPHPRRARRPRRPRPAATVEPGRPGMAGAAGPPGHPAQDHRRLLGADRPAHPDHHSLGARPAGPRQTRPARPGPDGPARDRADHRDDPGRRDRRHHPLPLGPQAVRLGRAHPPSAQLATAPSATATSPSKARQRSALCSRRPPSAPRPARPLRASTPSAPPAAAGTSPPSRSPASCSPAASTSSPKSTTTSTTTPPTTRRRRSPRRVRSRFRMCLQHGRLTDRGSPARTPTSCGPSRFWEARMGACEATSLTDRPGPSRRLILRRSSPASRSLVQSGAPP